MTFKIKMLAAAAVLAVPGLAAAQSLDVAGQVETPPLQGTLDQPGTPPLPDPVQDAVPPVQDQVPEALPPVQDSPDAQPDSAAEPGTVTAATSADVQAGAQVRDQNGAPVGTIESVDGEAAVLSTGAVRAEIPISSFGKDSQGLVIAMTRAQIEAAAGVRTPS